MKVVFTVVQNENYFSLDYGMTSKLRVKHANMKLTCENIRDALIRDV
jgi:hypothetical protein